MKPFRLFRPDPETFQVVPCASCIKTFHSLPDPGGSFFRLFPGTFPVGSGIAAEVSGDFFPEFSGPCSGSFPSKFPVVSFVDCVPGPCV